MDPLKLQTIGHTSESRFNTNFYFLKKYGTSAKNNADI